jgi:hypothetical protein
MNIELNHCIGCHDKFTYNCDFNYLNSKDMCPCTKCLVMPMCSELCQTFLEAKVSVRKRWWGIKDELIKGA